MATDTTLLELYAHQPLESVSSIRLLKLIHAENPNDSIHCRLIEVPKEKQDDFKFEALSWTWDTEIPNRRIILDRDDRAYALPISESLFEALQVLRYKNKSRTLWIDRICVNQEDFREKNHQIPMMPMIYGKAFKVCVWLGAASDDSDKAMDFIRLITGDLWKFDELCKPDGNYGTHWHALFKMIMRRWFSRRWIVQEIALARDGDVYCGTKKISWRKFTDAVSLFVETERITHRLSEIMQKEDSTHFIPDLFENIPDLSATLLIDTSDFLFRRLPNGNKEHLLGLEYLVSRLAIFNTSVPADAIYSLLAVAKNTSPLAADQREAPSIAEENARTLGRDLSARPFYVDYGQDYAVTCKDFVQFSIWQSEANRALDILCRPWAPPAKPKQGAGHLKTLPSWIRCVDDGAFMVQPDVLGERIHRINANPLVGLPFGHRSYNAAGGRKLDIRKLKFLKRANHFSMFVKGIVIHKVGAVQKPAQAGNLPEEWFDTGGWDWRKPNEDPPDELWRTLCANRGPDGRNPLSFYPTALRESLKKGWKGNIFDTSKLINYGRCSLVAQFLRRVQEVIYNKQLMYTQQESDKASRLGLVPQNARKDDLICILYGCTVPVILRRYQKDPDSIKEEESLLEEEAAILIQRHYRSCKARRLERKRKRLAAQSRPRRLGWYYFDLSREFALQAPVAMRQQLRIWFGNYQDVAALGLPFVFGVLIQHQGHPRLIGLLLAFFVVLALLLILFPRKLFKRIRSKVSIWFSKILPKEKKEKWQLVDSCYYELLGECYVHGMMDGEAINYQNENDIRPETFELR